MVKLLFSLMIFAVSHLALADDAPCHIPIESKAHGTKWGEITCLHCKNMIDFANFGAASMVDNLSSYTRMTVKNSVDDKQVLVTASATTRPTFLSIGWEFFSYNVRVDDHMNLEVSARTIKGRVTGKSWNSERTDKRHLRQACKTASEDEVEYVRKSVADDLAREAGNAARGDSAGLSPMPGLNSPSVPMPDDCSNCYSEPVNWWDWYYFRRF